MKQISKDSLGPKRLTVLDYDTKIELDLDKLIFNLNKSRSTVKLRLVLYYNVGYQVYCNIYKSLDYMLMYSDEDVVIFDKPNIDLVHMRASHALFELYMVSQGVDGEFNKYHNSRIELYSDAVQVYKRRLIGLDHRYPSGFITNLTEDERGAIYNYFVHFCCGYNENTIVELNTKDILRYRLTSSLIKNNAIFDIVKTVYGDKVKPWQMVKLPTHIFNNEDYRKECIDAILLEFNLDDVNKLSSNIIKSFAPGLLSYYKRIHPTNTCNYIISEYLNDDKGD